MPAAGLAAHQAGGSSAALGAPPAAGSAAACGAGGAGSRRRVPPAAGVAPHRAGGGGSAAPPAGEKSPRGLREVTGRSGTPRALGLYAQQLRPPEPHKATRAGEEFRDSNLEDRSPRPAPGARPAPPLRPPAAATAAPGPSPAHPPHIPPETEKCESGLFNPENEQAGRGAGRREGRGRAGHRPRLRLGGERAGPTGSAAGRLARVGRGSAHAWWGGG